MTDRSCARTLAIATIPLLIGACAHHPETIVLLPEKDGRSTAVVVRQDGRETVLDQPYAATRKTPFGLRPYTSTPEEVAAKFGPSLAAQPERPTAFTLYFVEGRDELTDESKQIVESVFSEIARRPVPDIVVIGHTDALGSDPVNDALARRRADLIRAELIRRGVAPENIAATGRGKREPIVPTSDGVAEPRNRRVEIFVR
jgi:outer membrane protein OmpA-like peptidoglycan-associated protein